MVNALYMVLGVAIFVAGQMSVSSTLAEALATRLKRTRVSKLNKPSSEVQKDVKEVGKNVEETPIPRDEFEESYDERIKQFRDELSRVHVSKTPPNFFEYDEREYLQEQQDASEIITEEYEAQQEQALKMHV